MKILILEDEALTRKHIMSELRAYDGEAVIVECKNLTEVRDRSFGKIFDAAFLDIRIGDNVEGIEAARYLRSNGTFNIVFMTAFSDPAMIKHAAEEEPRAYITKPVNSTQLVATLNFLREISDKGPSVMNWLNEGLGYADASITLAMSRALLLPAGEYAERVGDRLKRTRELIKRLRTEPDAVLFEDAVNNLCIALYACKRIDLPVSSELAESISLAISKLKGRAQQFLSVNAPPADRGGI